MHFQRLRLSGFKSFVDPTDFRIEPGLTGVVGPNGCGKSNLVEALRWVMGEASHKAMRAAGMDDVIFSGNNNRPARNTAEVAITIDNDSRTAPAQFNGEDTLEVSRDLLGKLLVRKNGQRFLIGRIVEVEAYLGDNDPATG